ncbi:MAG TPA: type IV pili twitching motility protein PilT, partial [Bryobacteraceae bacterium]|nr:type IV pili twitching motility protein PilT [Bryobacteraceae bacterium]
MRHTEAVPPYGNELEQIVAELNRAATGPRELLPGSAANLASLDRLLEIAARRGASDILLIADAPVALRIGGAISVLNPANPLNGEDTRNFLLPLLSPAQSQELQREKSADLCFGREGIGRFRANLHYQRGTI